MRHVKASLLAKRLGIPRSTMWDICENDDKLAFKRNNTYYIRVSELAKRPGFDLISAVLSTQGKWIKAVDLAKRCEIPRRTMCHWCSTRPNFAKRIGRIWYIDTELLGATETQLSVLSKRTTKEVS